MNAAAVNVTAVKAAAVNAAASTASECAAAGEMIGAHLCLLAVRNSRWNGGVGAPWTH